MVFSSIIFIAIFLPTFLMFYFIVDKITTKNLVLVIFSLIFYAWGEPIWIVALILSGTVDYFNGKIINKYRGKWQSKGALIFSLVFNLGMLFTFKYSNFFAQNLDAIFGIHLNVPKFNLPLGISFYTFQTLSYTIDLYLDKVEFQKDYIAFMAYVTMFPQLVAGPIVRYADISPRLTKRTITKKGFSDGITRFVIGLGKKVLLANSAGKVVDLMLTGDLGKSTILGSWLGIIMFTFQIYFDFSGYSDMAIGLGKMIGFDFKENFDYPYTSKSITDFWRRWHISLSSFFRDYIYIPLGGNRHKQIRNIFIVWFLTGMWHGASWNFVLWGIYYFVLLIFEKFVLKNILPKWSSPLAHFYSLFFVILGWALFYFTDMSRLFEFLKSMIGINVKFYDYKFESTFFSNIWIIIILTIGCTKLPKNLTKNVFKTWPKIAYFETVFVAIGFFVCFSVLLGQTYNPFLYFRF